MSYLRCNVRAFLGKFLKFGKFAGVKYLTNIMSAYDVASTYESPWLPWQTDRLWVLDTAAKLSSWKALSASSRVEEAQMGNERGEWKVSGLQVGREANEKVGRCRQPAKKCRQPATFEKQGHGATVGTFMAPLPIPSSIADNRSRTEQ